MGYRAVYDKFSSSSTIIGIDAVATRDINPGEELVDDYLRHGPQPEWAKQFVTEFQDQVKSMNFKGSNDFVE